MRNFLQKIHGTTSLNVGARLFAVHINKIITLRAMQPYAKKLLDKVLNGTLYVLNATLCYLVSPISHALIILGVISETNLIEDLTDETEQAMCITVS